MGVVYRAVHEKSGQEVALKTVSVAQNSLVESLRREIYALSTIRHPGIVRVLDTGVANGLPWYAMELLKGETLRQRLEAELNDNAFAEQATQRVHRPNLHQEKASELGVSPGDALSAEDTGSRKLTGNGDASRDGARPEDTSDAQDAVKRHSEAHEALHLSLDSLSSANGSRAETPPQLPTLPSFSDSISGGSWSDVRSPNPSLDDMMESEGLQNTRAQANGLPRREDFRPHGENADVTASGTDGRYRPKSRRNTPLSPEQLQSWLSLVLRLCAPLAYLHGEGIVHRDLKPENILIRGDGSPVLLDFGLMTRFRGEGNRDALMLEGRNAGSANYMAPEQISESTVDARSDLYSLGCILYELLTGTPPFAHESSLTITYGHIFRTPSPPSALVEGISPELDRLVLRLLEKRPADRLGYAEDVALSLKQLGAAMPAMVLPAARPYLYRSNFVGREEPIQQLRQALQRLQDGAGEVLFIGGESGIGKTRLVTELGRLATRDDLEVLSGRCLQTGGLPLEGFRQVLIHMADRCRERGEGEMERLLGRRSKLLALYEPSLASLPGLSRYPDPADLPEAAARTRLCTWLLDSIRALTDQHFLLIIVDDLQWADSLTLDFLRFLSTQRALQRSGVMVVGTYRTEECPPASRALFEHSQARHLELGRLEEPEITAMVQDILAQPALPPNFASYLAQQSEGNPFFVNEYLHAALDFGLLWRNENGQWQVLPGDKVRPGPSSQPPLTGVGSQSPTFAQDQYARLPLPGSLRALVGRRLEGLPGSLLPVLHACAVLGRNFSITLLRRTVALDDNSIFKAVQELLLRQILEEATAGRLRFTHDKLREVAYSQVPPEERRALHAIVASRIESLYPEARQNSSVLLGHHWERGGEPARARDCYRDGAKAALTRYAFTDAEQLLRKYLRLNEVPTEESIKLRNQLANEVLRVQGRPAEAYEEHATALEEARRIEFFSGQALSLCHLGFLRRNDGQLDSATELVEQGLDVARSHPLPFEQALLYNTLALLCFDRGNLAESERLFLLALELLEQLNVPRYEGVVLANYAALMHSQDRYADAWALYDRAIQSLRQANARQHEAQLMTNLGVFYLEQGRVGEAFSVLEQALAVHQETGDRVGQGSTQCVLAMVYRQALGELDKAERMAYESLNLLKEVGAATMQIYSLCELGHVALARGNAPTDYLRQLRELESQFQLGINSEFSRRIQTLEATAADLAAGRTLFRGNQVEGLPEGLRKALGLELPDDAASSSPNLP